MTMNRIVPTLMTAQLTLKRTPMHLCKDISMSKHMHKHGYFPALLAN